MYVTVNYANVAGHHEMSRYHKTSLPMMQHQSNNTCGSHIHMESVHTRFLPLKTVVRACSLYPPPICIFFFSPSPFPSPISGRFIGSFKVGETTVIRKLIDDSTRDYRLSKKRERERERERERTSFALLYILFHSTSP